MKYFSKILKTLKEKISGKKLSGLHITPSEDFYFIEIKKIKKSWSPIFWETGSVKNFEKKDLIEKLKKIKIKTNSKNIFLNNIEDEKLRHEIVSALKISGFENVIIKKQNKEGVILNKNTKETQTTAVFSQKEIIFYVSDGRKILKKEGISFEDLSVSSVLEVTKGFVEEGLNNKVFLIGVNKNFANSVTNILLLAGLRVESKNIWENFLDFSDQIPGIFLEDSYDFVDVLSITVPNLKNWKP